MADKEGFKLPEPKIEVNGKESVVYTGKVDDKSVKADVPKKAESKSDGAQ